MITVLLLVTFAWQFYIGYSRGIILQAYYLLASFISLGIASSYYKSLAAAINLWVPYASPTEGATVAFYTDLNIFDLDKVYYAGVAFTAIFAVCYAFFRLLGILIHFAPVDALDDRKWNVLSGGMAVLVTMIFFSLVFATLATVPLALIQNLLSGSMMVKVLVYHFPILTNLINSLWVTAILG